VVHHLPERLEAEVDRMLPEALEQAVAERLSEALDRAVEERLPEILALAVEAKLPEVLESARETMTAVGFAVERPEPLPPHVWKPVPSGEAGDAAENFSEAGRTLETGPDAEEEDDEEPLLLTVVVNDGLNPAARDSARALEGDGEARAAGLSGLTKDEAADEEDEVPILNLENPVKEETEITKQALGLRRPSQGKKNLEHRLATLDHWSRREPALDRPKKTNPD